MEKLTDKQIKDLRLKVLKSDIAPKPPQPGRTLAEDIAFIESFAPAGENGGQGGLRNSH